MRKQREISIPTALTLSLLFQFRDPVRYVRPSANPYNPPHRTREVEPMLYKHLDPLSSFVIVSAPSINVGHMLCLCASYQDLDLIEISIPSCPSCPSDTISAGVSFLSC